jgi:predicted short-subunit dehydrogenase-like oxidoreductase (DUF2520 family)
MKLVFIGSGNVAYHLSKAFHAKGFEILQVYSRTLKNAQLLAKELNSTATNNIKELNPGADVYFICLKDDSIETVLKQLKLKNKFLVHTSGSVAMIDLKPFSNNYGVFYPLQTFTKEQKVKFKNLPICLEANNDKNKIILLNIAYELTNNVYVINSEQRKQLHLAAVFANNFTNHLFAIADEILKKQSLPFELLLPLIKETVKKVKSISPTQAQTGPALRNDKKTIQKHLKMLSPNHKKLYEAITKSIQQTSLPIKK